MGFLSFSCAHHVSGNFFKPIFFLLLVFISFVGSASSSSQFWKQSDRFALLSFKSQIEHDPFGALNSWNQSLHHCHWQGITCSHRHHERVTILDMRSQKLEGTLSPHIGNLTFLKVINLTDNHFHGEIPREIGHLLRLQYLIFERNSFDGQIPRNIAHCSDLREFNLVDNILSGDIPAELSVLSKLHLLYLARNNFTGKIPASFGNLSSLTALSLLRNQLVGSIPEDLCGLQSLTFFQVARNKLTGKVPSCLYNLSNINYFSVQTNQLEGSLPSNIGHTLPNLQMIYVYSNNFNGLVPTSLFTAKNLEHVDLSFNSFSGEIPTNFTGCPNLTLLDLSNNMLSGRIPSQLSSLLKLESLALDKNNFTGNIPSSIGNLSSLTGLSLTENTLKGSIPNSICNIISLSFFGVSLNNLTGEIPSCLYNHSTISYFVVYHNQLEGIIPPNIGLTLPRLENLFLGVNKFSGPIPNSLRNATRLTRVDLANNYFSGSVPRDLGVMQSLDSLFLHNNRLGTKVGDDLEFVTSLTNCSHLERLVFGSNILKGIGNLVDIESLDLSDNQLTGNIPVIGKLNELKLLDLQGNMLSGKIPSFLGNMTKLTELYLSSNSFHGSIPLSLGNCKNIELIDLSHNKLMGLIPTQLTKLPQFSLGLHLQHNLLSGNLPSEVGNLTNLMALDVSENNLSGQIPESLGTCLNLVTLNLNNNNFEGKIPAKSFSTLKGLTHLDLSRNNLSGEIPKYFENFPLQYFNLSFNDFEGQVPTIGVFGNASVVSVVGNQKLCGGTRELKLPPCIQKAKRTSGFVKVIIPVIVGSLCLLVFSCFFLICYRKNLSTKIPASADFFNQSYRRTSYAELHKATNGFSRENLIGIGSYGAVFKGNLQGINEMIAVKVFNLQRKGASTSFLTECSALRNIRHRNLLKIITSCSSIDFQGDDFKALVFRFMPNGNLEDWLHGVNEEIQVESRVMNFIQRLKVAIDVASALEYLHHHYQPAIVHCDIKPSNVLLDEDMTACLADFGIAKILSDNFDDFGQSQIKSAGIKGSVGYVAPEYGMGSEVTAKGDVYSYGILLLEIFTKRKPTDDMFLNGLTLHSYAKMALPNQVTGIIDPLVHLEDHVLNTASPSNAQGRLHECLAAVVRLGVACSVESPTERMNTSEVVKELYRVIGHYQSVRSNSD